MINARIGTHTRHRLLLDCGVGNGGWPFSKPKRPFRPGTPRLAFVKAHALCCRFASVHVSLGFWVLPARLPLEGSERSAVPVLGRIELFGGRDPNGRLLAPLRRADHDRGGRMIGL